MTIKFLNHASFLIKKKKLTLICDPYLTGSAFNNGWSLITEEKHDLNNLTHIYFSHEHPDHFSIPFLKSIREDLRANITILFQETFDKRVISFCKNLGYQILECTENQKYKLTEDFFITIGKVPIYDSWLLFESEGLAILNVNDCPLDESDCQKIYKKIGKIDVLFTQFSYASWIDSKKNRIVEANKQLEKIKIQDFVFKPNFIVPFASFIYFSHEENFFMNDSINAPENVNNFILTQCKAYPIILRPNEDWNGIEKKNNELSLNFWRKKYLDIFLKKRIIKNLRLYNFEELKLKSTFYKRKMSEKNNKLLIYIFAIFLFRPVSFYLTDLNLLCKFSWFTGLKKINSEKNYISISSENLAFVFDYNYGIDTLYVNARFISSEFLKLKMIKLFLLGSLNNIGIFLRFRDLNKFLNFRILKRGFITLFSN